MRLCLKEVGCFAFQRSRFLVQDEWNWIAHGLAELYVRGAHVDWAQVIKGAGKCALPTYPFERRNYWYSPRQLDELSGADDLGRIGPQAASGALPSGAGVTPSASEPPSEDLFYEVVWKEAPLPACAAPSLLSPNNLPRRCASGLPARRAAQAVDL